MQDEHLEWDAGPITPGVIRQIVKTNTKQRTSEQTLDITNYGVTTGN